MNNVDLISRNALFDAMPKDDELMSFQVRKVIRDAPRVEASPVVHGKWLPTDYDAHKCSECGGREDYWWADKGTPFCPYCGAKMEVT